MKLKMHRLVIGALATAAMTLTGAAMAGIPGVDVPPNVTISSLNLNGSACPPGTAYVELTEDLQAFVITYDEFHATAGPGVPLQESVKSCTATINLSFPAGWSWTVSSVAYSGSAQLDSYVTGRFSSKLSFPGQLPVSREVRLPGPTLVGGQDFDLVGDYTIANWSTCGRNRPMTALATVQVDNSANRRRSGVIRVSQQTGEFQMVFNIDWRRCY
ncbi:DUF4360 domain-containing protein [Chondromyces apiculatus]|uniref:Secreted protein n=1 Tax=Chondromyces apiculatus DSM 436 TaxID=1192034 RepID=A0A017THS6_9BACT|nr:DUF4360 domain-containing protein [Chondromyces apiculatus]EYF08833.1 Hypothetical protein CAP_2694 [Chondromyces apiculatus DSM 436]